MLHCSKPVISLQGFICLCEHLGPCLTEIYKTVLSLQIILNSEILGRMGLSLRQLAQQTSIIGGGTKKNCNHNSQGRWSGWRVGDVLPFLGRSSSIRSAGTHRHLLQQLHILVTTRSPQLINIFYITQCIYHTTHIRQFSTITTFQTLNTLFC